MNINVGVGVGQPRTKYNNSVQAVTATLACEIRVIARALRV
jgi:hypothetical protein